MNPTLKRLLPLVLVIGLGTHYAIGDFPVRLANQYAEDSPVLYSRHFVDPEHWAGDAWMWNARVYTLGSLLNLVPALLLKWFGVAPELPALLVVYLQNLLLALAVYLYASVLTRKETTRWLSVLFVFLTEMTRWNASIYSSELCASYPAQMATALLVFSAPALLTGRFALALGMLLLGGWVHAGLGLGMAVLLGFHLLFKPDGRKPAAMAALFGVTLLSILPSLLASMSVADRATRTELMEILRGNPHLFPWLSAWGWNKLTAYALPTLAGFVALAGWAVAKSPPARSETRALIAAIAATFVSVHLLHAVGAFAGIPQLVQPAFPRIVGVLCILMTPFVLSVLEEKTVSASIPLAATAAASLAMLAFHGWGFHWGLAGALVLFDIGERRAESHWTRLGTLLPTGWTGAVVFSSVAHRFLGSGTGATLRFWLAPGGLVGPLRFAASLAVGASVIAASLVLRRHRLFQKGMAWGLVAVLVSAGAVKARELAASTRTSEARASYEAQMWAREHTPEEAIFVVALPDMNWRVMSLRRAINSHAGPGAIYSGDRRYVGYEREVAAYIQQHGARDLAGLEAHPLIGFARKYGAGYLVVAARTELPLPKVYANSHVALYRVE